MPKLQEYEQKLNTLNNRGSYSKTDPDATFMCLKEDHMKNRQLKPAYNLQIATENQFFTHYDFFANPTDFLTFMPFSNSFERRYGFFPQHVIADSGYGSEENYAFMQAHEIEGFVKYPMFHKEQKRSFRNNGFLSQNLFYNAEKDYFVCPMGQHMERIKTGTRESENGYISDISYYQAKRCKDCPLQCLCHKSQGNRIIEVNHRLNAFRRQARERLTSEQGLIYRSRRPIEPEAVFGQTKENKQYRRFRHFGGENVKMDFAIFAVAFNIGKLYNKIRKTSFAGKKSTLWREKSNFVFIRIVFIRTKIENQKYLQLSYPLAA